MTDPAPHPMAFVAGEVGPEARPGASGLWRVVGASETGAGHLRAGTPCQDAHAFLALDPDWLAIAVADGAGSAAQSEAGARLAVDVAVHELARLFRGFREGRARGGDDLDPAALQELLACALTAARVAVECEARDRRVPPRALACTLMVALLGPALVAASGVGDGGVVVEHGAGRLQTLLQPDVGEYVNETTFLTGGDALKKIRFAALATAAESVALFTDGLQPRVLHRQDWTPFAGFFAKVFGPLREEADSALAGAAVRQLLRSAELRRGTEDDLTLVVATRRCGGERATGDEVGDQGAAP